MLQLTTETPSAATFPPIVQERMATSTLLFLLSVVSSLCVLITVIRTSSIRSQLMGVMLINLASALLLHAIAVVSRNMETESRGGMGNFGTMGCHFYFMGQNMPVIVINAAIAIICLDTTFSLPQRGFSQVITTLCIWLFAIIFSVFKLYCLADGPHVARYDNVNLCFLPKNRRWPQDILYHLIFHLIPTTFVLFTLFRFCCSHSTNKATQGKKLPFVLTAVTYLSLMWAVELLIFSDMINNNRMSYGWSLSYWFHKALQFGRVVIPLIWVFLIPDLRSKFLCRKHDNERTEINMGDIAPPERNKPTQDVRELVLQHPKGEHSLTQTDGGIPLLPHTSLKLVRQQ